MASSRKKPAKKKAAKPFDFAKRSPAALASLSGKTADGKRVKPAKVRKTIENDETCLQKHCKQWLDKSGLWERLLIFHVANERKGSIGAAMHFKRMGVRPGVADWLAFPPGRAVAIELKDDEGDQSTDQDRFERKWKAAGNQYFLCRTLEEFQGVVSAITLFC